MWQQQNIRFALVGLANEKQSAMVSTTNFFMLAKAAIFGFGAGQHGVACAALVIWWRVSNCVGEALAGA